MLRRLQVFLVLLFLTCAGTLYFAMKPVIPMAPYEPARMCYHPLYDPAKIPCKDVPWMGHA